MVAYIWCFTMGLVSTVACMLLSTLLWAHVDVELKLARSNAQWLARFCARGVIARTQPLLAEPALIGLLLVRWLWIKVDFLIKLNGKHSEGFLPVRRLLARYLLWKDGWVAGWVSVTRRYCVICVKTDKPILNFFDPLVPQHCSFSTLCAGTQSQGNPIISPKTPQNGRE